MVYAINMNKLLTAIIPFLLFACNSIYQIEIYKDGTGHVNHKIYCLYDEEILKKDTSLTKQAKTIGGKPDATQLTSEESVQPYLNTKTISNFKWKTNKKIYFDASYDIGNIDSLGAYIDAVDNYVEPIFKFNKDEFIMICPPGSEDVHVDSSTFGAIFVELHFKFPYPIETVVCNNQNIKYFFSKREMSLKFRLEQLFYFDTTSEVRVLFK